MNDTPTRLPGQIETLIAAVETEGHAQAAVWNKIIGQPAFRPGAYNLACYMVLRHRDLRALQRPRMALGLSSLGRLEGRVLPALKAVSGALPALAGHPPARHPSTAAFFSGETRLQANVRKILGTTVEPLPGAAPVALLVTCPIEAADNGDFMVDMARKGVEAVRINYAHDSPEKCRVMIDNPRRAEAATGRRLKVFMDLAGPKIRTGPVRRPGKDHHRAHSGDLIALTIAVRRLAINRGDRRGISRVRCGSQEADPTGAEFGVRVRPAQALACGLVPNRKSLSVHRVIPARCFSDDTAMR